ncbi:MAG: SulP family inorganic anion transporter [Nonomuraea sp.]|nr:SulP family inorganic anion transporter [Streptomyces sp.]NUP84056.1 SulP family inorganic anion transporter [Nonomuraea sp.]NUS07247.1 SulP family inorganic anion transporter [Nonomuraea sp.]
MTAVQLFVTLRDYRRGWLTADLLAGLATGAVVVPQAMAYATVAGMPVQVGLYTCLVPMLVYVVLGGSRTLSTSTTSTIATLTASTLISAQVAAGSLQALATLTLEVGLLLLAGRILRLGPLVENISTPVLIGIKTGVGLVVAVGQLPKLLGIASATHEGFFRQLAAVMGSLGHADPATVALSATLLATLLAVGARWPRVPAPLAAIVVALLATVLLDLPSRGVALIDPIPRGLPVPLLPSPGHALSLLPGALAIAFMVFMESLAVARAMHRVSDPSLDNDRELLAAGAANTAGAFFQALPSAGGFSQTAVNDRAGARSQAAQLITAGLALAVALWLAPVLDHLPQAALAAVVVVAVLGLIQPMEFVRLARIDLVEFWLAAATALVGLTGGLLPAVAVGVGATLALVLRELNRVGVVELRLSPQGGLRPATPADAAVPGVLALRVTRGLYTANVRSAQETILHAVGRHDGLPAIVLIDLPHQRALSVTVLDAFEELDTQLAREHVQLWLSGLPPRALALARRTDWWGDWEASGRIRQDPGDAIRAAGHEITRRDTRPG